MKLTEKFKINHFLTGAIAGVILPYIFLLVYWLWSYKFMGMKQFINFLMMGKVLSAVISLCLIPNLGLFYIFINKEYYKAGRGMILSTLIYGFIIVYLKMWVEHSFGD